MVAKTLVETFQLLKHWVASPPKTLATVTRIPEVELSPPKTFCCTSNQALNHTLNLTKIWAKENTTAHKRATILYEAKCQKTDRLSARGVCDIINAEHKTRYKEEVCALGLALERSGSQEKIQTGGFSSSAKIQTKFAVVL